MGVERNRASWISVAALNEDPGVSAKRLSALAALFLSLRRHDPDQVRRVAAHPAASQPPVGAPLGCGNYPQSAALPSRLQAPGRILVRRVKKVWLSGAPDCPVSTGQRLSAPPLTPVFAGNLQVLTFSTITRTHLIVVALIISCECGKITTIRTRNFSFVVSRGRGLVAGGLDDAAMVLGDFRIEELMAQRFEAFEHAILVGPHQP